MSEENAINTLNPVAQKVVEKAIEEVLEEIGDNKLFNADILHYVRSKITSLIHERLGEEEIQNIDVLLDLRAIEDIQFAFKINVPKGKAEQHILDS